MNQVKYRKLRRSKYQFPTQVVRNGSSKGQLVKGADLARADIEKECGCSIQHLKKAHTPFEWRFLYPVGMSVEMAKEFFEGEAVASSGTGS